jgi:endonuclease/exonuclease/phosphatase family protein
VRIVVWNCCGALQKNLGVLARIEPDVVILPEAGEPSRVFDGTVRAETMTYEWIGILPNKGLGVMAFAPFELEPACPPDRALEWALPLRVRGPVEFDLLAMWAMNHRASREAKGPNRDRQLAGALETYGHLFDENPVVVAGDLNDSAIWDKPNGSRPFASKVELLRERGLVSAYHEVREEAFGSESEPTIYWRERKLDGPRFHIDYCFLPESWIPHTSVTVGTFDEWVAPKFSDHVPLIVDVRLPT